MRNPEAQGCPMNGAEKIKVKDAPLIRHLADRLINGEPIALEKDYPYDKGLLAGLEEQFKLVTGKTFKGEEVAGASETTTKEKLEAFRLLSQELTRIASLGIPALTTACYAAEVHSIFKDPELILPPEILDQEADPDSLTNIYGPSLRLLGGAHGRAYEKYVSPLIPDEVPSAAKITAETGKTGLGLLVLKTALETFADDPIAYREALLAMPRRHRIKAAEMPQQDSEEFAKRLDKTRRNTVDNPNLENIEYVNSFARKREGNYIDQTLLFILGSVVLRREGYTPQETEAILANSLSTIGHVAHYVFDTMPGNDARPDISDNPRKSFASLLQYTEYLSVNTQNLSEGGLPRLSIAPLPLAESPPYDNLDPATKQKLDKEGRTGGRCPARVAVDCSDEMRYFIDGAQENGYNLGSDYTPSGAGTKVKLSTLSALLALTSAQECQLFERLEQNPTFTEAIWKTKENAEYSTQ